VLTDKITDGAGAAGREGGELLADKANEMIQNGLSDMPPAVQEFGAQVGETLSATLPAAGEEIGRALAGKLVDAAAPVVAQGFSTGTQALRDLATGYRTAGTGAEGFGRNAAKGGAAAKTASIGSNLMAGAQKALNTVMRANPIGLIVTALGALVAGLVYAYQNSETFREIVDGVFSFVKEIAEGVMSFFTETLPGMWTALQEAAQDFWDGLVGLIETAWEWIKTILSHHPFALLFTYWDEITEFIGQAWDWLVEKTGEVWDWLVDKVTGVAEEIVEFLTGVWDQVTGAVETAWETVTELISTAWETVVDTVQGAVTWVVELVEGLRDRIGEVFSGLWERLVGIVGDIASAISSAFEDARKWAVEKFEALRTGVEEKVEAVLDFVGGLPDKIMDFFSGAKDFLLDAGKDIVNGLLDGIEAMWQKVKDKLSGLTDLIPDWKGPPGVDKKLLTPAGRMIMDGLMDGIDDRFPDLRGQLGDVSGEITKRMVPASLEVRDHAAARSGSPLARGGPVVNIERFEATEEMTPHEVGDRLMFLMRSRGM
jgi:phage-related protein